MLFLFQILNDADQFSILYCACIGPRPSLDQPGKFVNNKKIVMEKLWGFYVKKDYKFLEE